MAARTIAILGFTLASGTALADSPNIKVAGTCSASTLPDRARLEVSVERRSPDVSRAIADATTAYNRFRADVEKLHLPDAELDSSGVQAGRVDEDPDHPRPAAFSAVAGLAIVTSSLQGLADVTRVAAQDHIDSVGALQSYVSDALRDRLVAGCLPRATADARTKATALLHGLDATPGAVQNVDGFSTDGETMQPMQMAAGPMMRKAVAQPTAQLSAGRQTITVTTTVTFAIAPPAK